MGQGSGREQSRGQVDVLSWEAGLLFPGPLPLSFCLPFTFPTSPLRCPPTHPRAHGFASQWKV